jgi:hypothetical protein
LRSAARNAPEKWDTEAQAAFVNMVVMSGAETALLRAVDDAGRITVPITIGKRDLIGGLLLWDTADGASCDTPGNIAKRQFSPGVVFLFTGDLMKLTKLKPLGEIPALFTNLGQFESLIENMHGDIARSGRATLLQQTHASGYFKLRELLLRTKAHLLTERNESTATAQFVDTAKRLGL